MTYKVPTWSVCFLTFHLHLIPSCLPVIMVGESSVRPFWSSYRPSPHLPPGSHLEQRKIYCRAVLGEQVAHASSNPKTFEHFKGQVREGDCRVCDQHVHNSFFFKFIFNWRIIALQYCVGFCHTSTWISHRYTYIPSLLNFPSHVHNSCLGDVEIIGC